MQAAVGGDVEVAVNGGRVGGGGGRGLEGEVEVVAGEGVGAGLVLEGDAGLGIQGQHAGGVEAEDEAIWTDELVLAVGVPEEVSGDQFAVVADVVAARIDDGVQAIARVDDVGVVTGAAFEDVVAAPADQGVVVGTADEVVVVGIAFEVVVAGVAGKGVVAGNAVEVVGVVTADQWAVGGRTEQDMTRSGKDASRGPDKDILTDIEGLVVPGVAKELVAVDVELCSVECGVLKSCLVDPCEHGGPVGNPLFAQIPGPCGGIKHVELSGGIVLSIQAVVANDGEGVEFLEGVAVSNVVLGKGGDQFGAEVRELIHADPAGGLLEERGLLDGGEALMQQFALVGVPPGVAVVEAVQGKRHVAVTQVQLAQGIDDGFQHVAFGLALLPEH